MNTKKNSPELKFLIVEDNEESAYLLKTLLAKFQAEILLALNGEQAVKICEKHKDINLILMDIKMPVMDGFRATQKIREFNKEVVIIAQTAYAHESDTEQALAIGCNDLITKPIDIGNMLKITRKHLNLDG